MLGPKELHVPRRSDEGLALLNKAAEQGYPEIYSAVGMLYAMGLEEANMIPDQVKALEWFAKAAKAGDLTGQVALGTMYYQGDGVPRNMESAAKWFNKAAERGDALSQHNLGHMLHKGEGLKRESAEGISWYTRSADQGFPEAQFELGIIYSQGEGVTANETEALKWFLKAAKQGHEKAKNKLLGMGLSSIIDKKDN